MDITLSLVQQAKDGDKEAFGALYAEIYRDLFRFAYYTLGNREDAEDAVSEAFLEGFRGLKNLRDEKLFRAWMMRIISIRCKRKIRQYVTNRQKLDPEDISEHVISFDLNIDSDERLALLAALSTLDHSERTILILSVVEGYKTREIAQILSCPQGTVSSKLYRTLKKLRAELERK
ncbi:MAG: RNA polymerase sigma factor [Acetanaerobacterium sp.]